MKAALIAAVSVLLSGCAGTYFGTTRTHYPEDGFMANLNALCGQSFEGKVISTDAVDAAMASQRLVMTVRDCSQSEVRIPFSVGEDRSRTWIVSRTEAGLRLKHDHRYPDGTPHALHMYGGDSVPHGGTERQSFPVDAFSIALFNANDAAVSTTNVWNVEIHPGRVFAYELRRANRHFRVEFDLTRPIRE
ncbi:hypothetical protein [Brevundimonas sp. NIBR11]|uniref:hypothetical protein n=1 Tax=Brevundimonas sp. NIBR11 TaxID=3015999 RepID=UPI0022F11520|nr:hypothetical protein [Brevundimonas sp. NIBR11]WGM31704.1 hypothetical protein KKHFBJBL_01952 [Brevundimonas sp. NIBR11]